MLPARPFNPLLTGNAPMTIASQARPCRWMLGCLAGCLAGCLSGLGTPSARATQVAALADLSLEQLREVVVTTVSRSEERLDRAPAAAYVISADDIRRSGATTLPEVLRLAPALNVARADGSQYAISARGFNNVLANRMLVLIDGRAVYSPLFSGVFWEAQDVMLEDVERIEVVSGPSTALWGTNAVNGLIHIVTRNAAATQGLAVSVNAGDEQRGAALRYGMALGERGHLRAYAKSYDRSQTHRTDGTPIGDAAHGVQLGFRADWALPGESLSLHGDVYQGKVDQLPSARSFSGVNLLARWDKTLADGAEASLQAYVERTEREHPQSFTETLDTVDVVGQYGLRLFDVHRLLVGGGYRHSRDDTGQFTALGFLPPRRGLSWSRVFVQDRVSLTQALAATAAVSVERNPYTGTEVLPSLRLAWQMAENRMVWGAISRAVRAPSRIDRELVQPARPPYVLAGGPDFRSEVSNVLELGLRDQPAAALSYSATLFHYQHTRLRSLAPTPAGLQIQNGIEGWTRGLEGTARWRVNERWRFDAGLTLLQQRLTLRPGAIDLGGMAALGNDPRRWASLRSTLDIGPRWSWDVSLRYVGALPNPRVPSYTAVDTRCAWRITPDLEAALALRNLFDPGHAEWTGSNRVESERSALLQLRWRL